jgi:hypothetical protein
MWGKIMGMTRILRWPAGKLSGFVTRRRIGPPLRTIETGGLTFKIVRLGKQKDLLHTRAMSVKKGLPVQIGRITPDKLKIKDFRPLSEETDKELKNKPWRESWILEGKIKSFIKRAENFSKPLSDETSVVLMAIAGNKVHAILKADVVKEERYIEAGLEISDEFSKLEKAVQVGAEMYRCLHEIVERWNKENPGWVIEGEISRGDKTMRRIFNILGHKRVSYNKKKRTIEYVKRFSKRES